MTNKNLGILLSLFNQYWLYLQWFHRHRKQKQPNKHWTKLFNENYISHAGPILESKGICAILQKKGKQMLKKGKKGQNIWKFEQKGTKFENILKKGRWLHAITARNNLPEQALSWCPPWCQTPPLNISTLPPIFKGPPLDEKHPVPPPFSTFLWNKCPYSLIYWHHE